jgi:hypothetical protein
MMYLTATYPDFRGMGKSVIQYIHNNMTERDRFILTLKFMR